MSKAQPNLPGAGVTVRFVRDDGLTFIGVTLGGELYTPGAAAAKLAAAAGLSTAEQARARNVAITMTHQPREPFQEGQGWAYYRFGATTQLYVARDDGTHMSWGVSAPLFTPGRAATALVASTTLSASELARLSAAIGSSVGNEATATPFAFADNFDSGNAIIQQRPGWQGRGVGGVGYLNTTTGGKFTNGDGFSYNMLDGQDLGRLDNGYVQANAISGYAIASRLSFNWIDPRNYCFLAYVATTGRLQIGYVKNGVSSTTPYDSGGTAAGTGAALLRVEWSWSGGTITIKAFVDGARYPNGTTQFPITDATLGFGPSGLVGISNSASQWDNYACGTLNSTALPRLTLNNLHKVYQRHKTTNDKAVPLGGTYEAGVTSVEMRLLQNGTLVSGWDWGQKAIAGLSLSAGVWTGATQAIPQGTGYTVEVRATNDTAAGGQSWKFAIGRLIIISGQSLAQAVLGNVTGRTAATPADTHQVKTTYPGDSSDERLINPVSYELACEFTGEPTNSSGTGSVIANTGAALLFQGLRASGDAVASAVTNIPVRGSTPISSFRPDSTVRPYTSGPNRTLWENITATIDYFGGDFELLVWHQGQEDAGRVYNTNVFGSSQATQYKTDLAAILAGMRSYTGRSATQLPVLIVTHNKIYPPSGTIGNYAADASFDLFRKTQFEFARDNAGVFLGAQTLDLTMASTATNEVHLATTATGYGENAIRIGYDVAKALGLAAADRRGPLPLSAVSSGSTIAITFNVNTATALTCAAAVASNFKFWTDNTYATPMTPTAMSIGTIAGGQCVVTFTFGAPTAAGNVVTTGKGGAYSTGGAYPDTANALLGTQADGFSVISWPIYDPLVVS